MNYYERHLGDYAKDTGHLSMLEHGAYSLLLDRYYSTEQGIPQEQAHRVARARSREEKEAVDSVLREFFVLENGIWINHRADEEIEKAQAKIKAAQTNGRRGGRPAKTQQEPKPNPNLTQQKPSGFSLEPPKSDFSEKKYFGAPHQKISDPPSFSDKNLNEINEEVKPTGFNFGFENETQQKAHQTPVHQIKASTSLAQSTDSNDVDADSASSASEKNQPPPDEPDEPIPKPTRAGAICAVLRAEGIADANPQHPRYLALLAAGSDPGEWAAAARAAVRKKRGFAYMLGVVDGWRKDAAATVVPRPPATAGPVCVQTRDDIRRARNAAAAEEFLRRGGDDE